jgi:Eco57I restriction-modification methylase
MTDFGSVKIVGGLLPADLLGRVFAGNPQVPGTGPDTYGLEHGESVRRQASRSWLYLVEVWQDFQRRIDSDESGQPGTGAHSARVTRERWLHILLRELGFHQVVAEGGIELDGKSFPVSHRSGRVPMHLLGWATDLDHKTPHVTARAPQSMVQELLNRDDSFLWAILSNGAVLRLLRDSTTLVGSSYVEFDLAAIFDGELFSDFVLLYLICHESRFAIHRSGDPDSCYLEQWRGFAAEQGQRALDQLRDGVKEAISILGTGFLSHPDNPQLRTRLDPRNADLKLDDFNRALLRLVYRLLFWFVAEDRGALLQPDPEDAGPDAAARLRQARDRYATYFSSARLRQLARRHRGGRHGDLFEAAELVFDALGTEGGVPALALAGIGGIFESKGDDGQALPLDEPLAGARLSNEALLGAVRALSLVTPRGGGARRRVDFGNLGAEELGSVYESLLELIPRYDDEQLAYTLEALAGNERKESGSYYTPTSLVECLLDSALDPLLDQACAHATAEERIKALLYITVCDPACGSGHFLVAAARRIAKRVAAEETGESEPPDAVVRAALRRVVGRCIYGVDINPMAAELAKVSLWLEALEPGKPLSYLDQNIRVGNSLLGVTPALLADGLPNAAFTPIDGDDRRVTAALKKQNAGERGGQHDLFSQAGIPVTNAILAKRSGEIAQTLPDSLEDLHIHQQRQAQELAASAEHCVQKLLADAWCAAFVQPKTAVTRSTAITQSVLERFADTSDTLDSAAAEDLVGGLVRQYRFFHWHVEFPHIFRVGNGARAMDSTIGWSGGFSCVIGNPPWERVKLQEQEFFASRSPAIANAANAAARKKLIAALALSDSPADRALYREFEAALRMAAGWSHLLRESGRYPLTGRGDINTYAVFGETARAIISATGRSGLVLPTGIATDATTAPFFADLVDRGRLIHVYGFRNNRGLFKGVGHGEVRFCLIAFTGSGKEVPRSSFAFDLGLPSELNSRESIYQLSKDQIALVNPNTKTCPTFKDPKDAEITLGIYSRIPILWRDDPEENSWGVSFMAMFHMANDSGVFRTKDQLGAAGWTLDGNIFIHDGRRMLPLYEGKMVYHYDHRFGDYRDREEGTIDHVLPRTLTVAKTDPNFVVMPRYWIQDFDTLDNRKSKPDKPIHDQGVGSKLRAKDWNHGWLFGWRDICRSTDERTMICSVLPRAATSHTYPLVFTPSRRIGCLYANLSSFVLDYTSRSKISGAHLTYGYLNQLPVLPPDVYDSETPWCANAILSRWVEARVLELTFTAWDMMPFAYDLGDNGPPFRWNEDRRMLIRAELDAAYFHMYRLERDEVEHVMESFDSLARREEKPQNLGEFRTKRLILERYDAMAEAIRTGEPYRTVLDPQPGYGPRHPTP